MPAPKERPLALTAAWSGLATALVAAIAGVAAVAVVWLPAASTSGGTAGSVIRAGILTFLAGVHGGVTVDGLPTAFVPLGLTVVVGVLAWRATVVVADTADDLGHSRPATLLGALAAQSGAFATACAVLAATATLGTSSASVIGAFVAGFVLTALVGAAALVRHTALGDDLRAVAPPWLGPAVRCAVVVLAVQLAAGALLVVGSLIVHHDRVVTLSREIGGGWSSVPVLLLGVLAVPNAVIAGAGYLSGAGFAVGSGTGVGLTGTSTGLVPAFPILGALPEGDGATLPVWLLALATPLVAGGFVAALAGRADRTADRWRDAGLGIAGAALLGAVLAWQGGGDIGSGRLHAVGVSPWQYALALALGTGLVTAALFGLRAALEFSRTREVEDRPGLRATIASLSSVVETYTDDDLDHEDVDHEPVMPRGKDADRRGPLAG